MKIIYATNVRLPTEKAHGIQIMSMCAALAAVGYEVRLVAPRRRVIADDPFVFYSLPPTFIVKKLPVIDLLTKYPSVITFFLERISFAASFFFYIFKNQADFWYTRDEMVALILSLFRKKYVLELHRLPRQKWWLSFLGKNCVIVTTTTALAQALRRLIAADMDGREPVGARIIVAHDGVDLVRFASVESTVQARAALGLSEMFTIMYVGRLETMGMEKGLRELITAFAGVIQQRPQTQLLIVGGPNEAVEKLHVHASNFGLAEKINFVGQIAYSEIPKYLAAADIAVMPFPDTEHYRYWMSPLKLFEYLAAGKAIVTSDLSAVREVVNDTEVYFVPANNESKLVSALIDLIDDAVKRAELGQRARAAAAAYTWSARAQKIMAAFSNRGFFNQ